MIPNRMLRGRLLLALMAGALCPAVPGFAQDDPIDAEAQPGQSDAISDYLRRLATNPDDAGALAGAADEALAMGDAEGAATFYARAEEIRPRDGHIKAGLGAALVHLGQPQAAIRLFEEAAALGVSAADLSSERGLAYDMLGDPRRAQREYRLGLQRGPDDELSRRLALSLAISGERAAALEAIDPQLRRQDRAGWRTRAFVLALTGDASGATQAAAAVMTADRANAMRPFFAQLPSLDAAQRAMAVHLGEIPSDGRSTQLAGNFDSGPYAPPLVADQTGVLLPRRAPDPEPPSTAPRRRPDGQGSEINGRAAAGYTPQPSRPGAAVSRPAERAPEPVPIRTETAAPVLADRTPPAPSIAATDLPPSAPATALLPPRPAAAGPGFDAVASVIAGLSQDRAAVPPDGAATPRSAAPIQLAQGPAISATPEQMRDVPRIERAPGKPPLIILPPPDVQPAAVATADAKPAAKPAEKKPAAKKAEPPTPKEPARFWVQVAGGADKGSLPREFKRLQGKAPTLLGSRTAWTAPLRATNRLLVGPFKSVGEAQKFVNDLAEFQLTAFSWTSEAGQAIEKLAIK